MALELIETNNGKTVEVHVSGKLTSEDYHELVPHMERLMERHGKISLLFEMRDFHGWEAGALWQDLKFGMRHFSDLERVAMVGEKRWEKWMAEFCRPFTRATIRYFDLPQLEEAREWVGGHMTEAAERPLDLSSQPK